MSSLPNILTICRIVAILPILAFLAVPEPWAAWMAGGLFVAAAITDWFDGYLARSRNWISAFGKVMDSIADKMLVTALLLSLVAFGQIAGWHFLAALIILLREVLISGLREYLAGHGGPGLPTSPLARWKTAAQMLALAFLIVGPATTLPFAEAGLVLLWLAALLTVVTGWDYTRSALRQVLQRPE